MLFGVIPIAPVLAGLIAILCIALIFAWYLSRPIQTLRSALHQIAQGDFATRASPRMQHQWRDEIVDLGHDIDLMAEQLQRAVESQRALLHDVSHELRSPLTRMQAAIGLLQQNPELSLPMLARIASETEKLDALVEELLTLHRLDAGVLNAPHEYIDIIELLRVIVEDASFEANACNKALHFQSNGPFFAWAQGELLYRAFENVIRNAVKYSPEGQTVEIHTQLLANDELQIQVNDRGPWGPDELQKRIFDPFYRIEACGQTRGTGLGLAIAQRTLRLHHGKISVASREQGGFSVSITLPKSAPEQGGVSNT